ncbi:MAG: hypothetical protein ACI8W7_001883 [Gammaproteobacteria bacterium]|jgi:hypothetical protein
MRVLSRLTALLFGLLFAIGGLFFVSGTAWPMWQDWHAMRDWQPVQAQLRSLSGSNNDTKAQYSYEMKGVSYRGDRVYVAVFNDNIGSYHSTMLGRLKSYQRAGGSVPIWVNPRDASQAVIDREMRWGLFSLVSGFCSIFIFIGLLIPYFSIRKSDIGGQFKEPSLATLREEWQQEQQDANFKGSFSSYRHHRVAELRQQAAGTVEKTHWMTRKSWASKSIRSEAKTALRKHWFFAFILNAISSSMFFVLPEELAKGNYMALIGVIFPLVGVVLLYKALAATLEYRRFGVVPFEMDPFPGAIGGHVGGQVRVARLPYNTAVESSSQCSVRLECVYSYMSGSGKNRSRREDIKWAEEGSPQIERAARGVNLAFRFDVPDNLPEADVKKSDGYHFWRLTVKADIQGANLDRQYDIPVYRTGESSRYVRHDVSAQAAERKEKESAAVKQSIAQGDFDVRGLSRAMRFTEQGDSISIAFPMFRNKTLSVFAAVFAGGFGFASYSMISMALGGGGFGIFIGLFCVPFFLVAVVASLAAVYLPFNNLRVSIQHDQVIVLRRLMFMPIFYRRLSTGDLSHLTIKRSGSTGGGVDKIEHFKILAHDKQSKSITLAEGLDGADVAGHFRDYLAQRLNVESRA